MKILETRVMRGPNQWSDSQRQLVVLKIASGQVSDEQISQIVETYRDSFMDLHGFAFSSNFPKSIQLVQFLACHLQSSAGMDCSYSRIKPCNSGNEYFLIYSYV